MLVSPHHQDISGAVYWVTQSIVEVQHSQHGCVEHASRVAYCEAGNPSLGERHRIVEHGHVGVAVMDLAPLFASPSLDSLCPIGNRLMSLGTSVQWGPL